MIWRATPVALFCVLLAWVHFSEWYEIGYIKNEEVIKEYHFGSEAMVGNGGSHYKSAESYAKNSLIYGLIAVLCLGTICLAIRKMSYKLLLSTYLVGGLVFVSFHIRI